MGAWVTVGGPPKVKSAVPTKLAPTEFATHVAPVPALVANPRVPYLIPTTFQPTGTELPASVTWDILSPAGASLATETIPNGWAVSLSAGLLTVTAPSHSLGDENYKVRFNSASNGKSAVFDVVPRVHAGLTLDFWLPTGGSQPGPGSVWDVRKGGLTVASSASPNGWSLWIDPRFAKSYRHYQLQIPVGTTVGTFELRENPVTGTRGSACSGFFDVGFSVPLSAVPNPPLDVLADAMTLPMWMEHVAPSDESDAPGAAVEMGSGGPASAISVDMVHGVVDIGGSVDMIATNPHGSDVIFERRYRTVLAAASVSSPGLPDGWVHNWDYRIVPQSQNTWAAMLLRYPNGAAELLTPVLDGSGQPTGQFTEPAGAPYIAEGVPGSNYTWSSITLKQDSLSKEVFTTPTGDTVLRLQSQTLENGSFLTMSYSSGLLTQIQGGPSGGAAAPLMNLTYSGGLLNTIADTLGNSRTFTMAGGQLTAVSRVNATNSEWAYQYTTVGNTSFLDTVKTTDPHGILKSASIDYDLVTGRAESQADSKNNTRAYEYLFSGGATVSVSGASGLEDRYTSRCDELGRQISMETAAGDLTAVEYASIDPSVVTKVARPLGPAVQMETDSHGNVTKITYPYGNRVDLTWDYPAEAPLGRVTRVQEFGKTGQVKQPVDYSYYASGEPDGVTGFLKEVTYPHGGFTRYTYTALGNVRTVEGPSTTVTYDYTTQYPNTTVPERLGQPYSVVDALQRKSWFDYDNQGRLIWTRDPMGNVSSLQLNQYGQPINASLPASRLLQFTYQSAGKDVLSASLSAGGSPLTLFQNTYDAESALNVTRDPNNNPATLGLNGQFNLTSLLNGNGRPMHQFTPLPFSKQGQVGLGTGAKSLNFKATFDANGLLSNVGQPNSGLQWDGVTSQVQANGQGLREYPPGVFDDLISSDRGSGTSDTTYTYDQFGRVSTSTVEGFMWPLSSGWPQIYQGVTRHTYQYDDLDRVTSDTVMNGWLGGEQTVSYVYNPDGTRKFMHLEVCDGFGNQNGGYTHVTYKYTYDAGLRTQRMDVYGGFGTTGPVLAWATYEYDLNDRVTAVRTPKATTLYTYDELGQVRTLLNLTPDNVRDPWAPANYWFTEPNGTYHSILSSFVMPSADGYDLLGNRTHVQFEALTLAGWSNQNPSQFGSGEVSFTYDNGGRLWAESWTGTFGPPRSYTHGYDSADNLTTLRGSTWTIDQFSDQVTATTQPGFTGNPLLFDSTGNRKEANLLKLHYFLPNGLAVAEGTTADTTLTGSRLPNFNHLNGYDAEGRRIYQSVRPGQQYEHDDVFMYDGSEMVFRWTTANQNNPQWFPSDLSPFSPDRYVLYLWGPTGPVMEFDTMGSSRTFLYDPQGSCVNTAEFVADRPIFYDGYGMPVWMPAFPENRIILKQPFQYKGQGGYYTDVHTGLIYCWNRYYDPQAGRWVSRDPIGLDGGVNVYGYCRGNPVMRLDPFGLDDDELAWWHPGKLFDDLFLGGGIAGAGAAYGDWESGRGSGWRVTGNFLWAAANSGASTLTGGALPAAKAIFRVGAKAVGKTGNGFTKIRTVVGTARLQSLANKASKTAKLTSRQAAAAQARPGLAKAMRGNAVDAKLKQLVANDPISRALRIQIAPRFKSKPDFFINAGEIWWDLTTPRAWPSHITKYPGKGTRLRYK
jgi:RHS repeat-associated protein